MRAFDSTLTGVFSSMKGVPPRARYLACWMHREGLIDSRGKVWQGTVSGLADAVGYSDGGVSSSLKKLVDMGFLLESRSVSGRSVKNYRAGPKMKFRQVGDRVLQVLEGQERCFQVLSVPERCLLAQLWLTLLESGPSSAGLDKSKACVVTGMGVVALAKAAGVGRSTAQRLLASLHKKSFIVASTSEFTADGVPDMTKTYFLLGPAMLEGAAAVFRWRLDLGEMLDWLAGEAEGYSVNHLLAEVYDGKGSAELAASLQVLNDPARRYYILVCLCAAVSNGFLWGRKGRETGALSHIEAAMLRAMSLQVTGPKAWHFGIENRDPREHDGGAKLYGFVAVWAGVLLDKVAAAFPRPPQVDMQFDTSPSYMSARHTGEAGGGLQVDAVFFNADYGNNFRVKVEGWHAHFGMPMPEIVGVGK